MLDRAVIPISFSGGVDTKTDSKLVLPGKLTLLENGIFRTKNSIIKRNGYDSLGRSILGSTSTLSSGQSLHAFKNELIQISGNHLYSYSPSSQAYVDKGACYSVKVTKNSIVRNSAQQSAPDMAVNQNVAVYAWQDSRGGIRATVIDTETGVQYQSDVSVSASGTLPRCVSVDNFIFVLYADGTNLRAKRLSLTLPTSFEAELTFQTNLNNATPYYDAVSHGLKAVVAYHSGSSIKVFYFTLDGAVGSTVTNLPNPITIAEDPANCLSVVVEPTTLHIYIFYHNGTAGLRYTVLYESFGTLLSPTTIDATLAPVTLRVTGAFVDTTIVRVFYEVNATNSYDHYIKTTTVNAAGTVTTPSVLIRSLGLASKAFKVGSTIYVTGVYDSTLQATYFTLDSTGTVFAKLIPGAAGGLPTDRVLPTAIVSGTEMNFPMQIKTKFVSEGNTTFTLKGISQGTIEFSPDDAFQAQTLGENLHFTGGFLSSYDGLSVVEHGFHLFPENIAATPATTTGSMADGIYAYYVVFEWVDNQGQTHRSAPSVAVSATVSGGGGNGKVTLTIPTLRVTSKSGTRSNVSVAIYRTKASGTVAFKVTSVSSPTFNSTSVDTLTYVDTQNDSAIGANEILYTSGGVIENIAPPACSSIDVYQNRMVLVLTEDPLTVSYSKIKVKGEGAAFNDSFLFNVDPLGGDVTVAKMMDDKIIIFKNDLIFYVYGDGPLDTGQQNNYSIPQLVTSDVGCPYPLSVVLMPEGLMFKSYKGIYLLNRSLQVSYIGADVDAYNTQSVTGAHMIQNTNQVRFLTSSGKTLMYDYLYNQWSTFTNHEGIRAAVCDGVYSYLRSDGKVYQESSTRFQDENVGYRLRIGTAWLKTSGIQGFQRVRRAAVLGNYRSSHTLRMSVGYDYEETYPNQILFVAGNVLNQNYYGDDATFGSAAVYGSVIDNTYQFTAHLPRQKCQAIRFLFEDVTAGTPGEAYSLSDLSLEVGVKRGLNKMRLAKKVG